jgi:hypothetical protein
VRLLHLFMVLFYQVFYVTILNYFMGTTNCNWLSSDKALRFRNVDFYPEGEAGSSSGSSSSGSGNSSSNN